MIKIKRNEHFCLYFIFCSSWISKNKKIWWMWLTSTSYPLALKAFSMDLFKWQRVSMMKRSLVILILLWLRNKWRNVLSLTRFIGSISELGKYKITSLQSLKLVNESILYDITRRDVLIDKVQQKNKSDASKMLQLLMMK